MKFVPGQPYCGQITPSSTEGPLQGSVTKEDLEKEQSAVETNTSAASRRNTAGGKWPTLDLRARGWSNACWPAGKEP